MFNAVETIKRVFCSIDNNWCFKPTRLSVSVPSTDGRYQFVGNAYINCVRDNQGSCSWNHLENKLRMTQNNTTYKEGYALTNSLDIGIQMCAAMRFYPPSSSGQVVKPK